MMHEVASSCSIVDKRQTQGLPAGGVDVGWVQLETLESPLIVGVQHKDRLTIEKFVAEVGRSFPLDLKNYSRFLTGSGDIFCGKVPNLHSGYLAAFHVLLHNWPEPIFAQ